MDNNQFKATEAKLYKYNETITEIKCIRISIRRIEEDFKGCGSIDYSNECCGGNGFNSKVENEVIEREREISKLRKLLNKKEEEKDKIDSVIESLSDAERQLVELKYTSRNTRSWEEVGFLLKFSPIYCKTKLRRRVINKFKNVLFIE